jgi:hypothetical protein
MLLPMPLAALCYRVVVVVVVATAFLAACAASADAAAYAAADAPGRCCVYLVVFCFWFLVTSGAHAPME